MRDAIEKELEWFFWGVITFFVLWAVFSQPLLWLALISLGLLARHFYHFIKLARWMEKGKKYSPPVSHGGWGLVFDRLYNILKRQRKRNKRLGNWLKRFRESTAALPDGVVVLSPSGEIEWSNDAASSWLGIKYPQDVGHRLINLVRKSEFSDFMRESDPEARLEISSPTEQSRQLSMRLIPYGKNQQLLLIRDVTLMSRVERMRRDFIANISHELRTPLTVINGYLESLVTDVQIKHDTQLYNTMAQMQQQSHRMARLVEDLLLLSRLENIDMKVAHETVPVPQMVVSLQEEARLISGERQHKIEAEIDEQLYLLGDSRALDGAFRNLVVNAVNYTPAEGTITLRWYRTETGACFEVQDTGIGISRHHLSRLTERFYRVNVDRSRETGGSGLGLAIVKHALERHTAHLEIDSELGKGSIFRCHFPQEIVVEMKNGGQKVAS